MRTLAVSLTFVIMAAGAAADPRPNILILLADDLGIGDLSCYGNRSVHTSHLDRLAAQGVRLTHHVAAAAACTPSRTALLTGRYPVRSGMQEARGGPPVVRNTFGAGGLPRSETTFGRALRDAGYRTKYVGKWHQGWSCQRWQDQCHGPNGHGFQSFFGLPFTLQEEEPDPPLRRQRAVPFLRRVLPELLRSGAERPDGADGRCLRPTVVQTWHMWLDMTREVYYNDSPRREWWGHTLALDKFFNYQLVRDSEVVSWPYQLPGLTQRLLAESEQFLHEAAHGGQPFLLVHSFLHPHTPLFTAPAFQNVSGHSRYADNVLEMDWAVGRLLAALEEAGVSENTLVYFASDHGAHLELEGSDGQREGGSNAPFRGGKGQGGMEGGIRVPALVRWPGRIPAGRTVDVPTSAMDLLPTLLEAAGVDAGELGPTLDGRSMLALLEGRTEAPTHRFLAHYCGADVHALRYAPEAERAVYKLYLKVPRYPRPGVQHCGQKDGMCLCYGADVVTLPSPQLFDVVADPSEREEIVPGDPRYEQHVPEMLAELERHRRRVTAASAQMEAFDLGVARPELVPWGQLSKFRGVDFDMHGLDDWLEFAGTCSKIGGVGENHCGTREP